MTRQKPQKARGARKPEKTMADYAMSFERRTYESYTTSLQPKANRFYRPCESLRAQLPGTQMTGGLLTPTLVASRPRQSVSPNSAFQEQSMLVGIQTKTAAA